MTRVMALLTDAYGGIGGIAKFNRDLLGALADVNSVSEVIALARVITKDQETVPEKVVFDRKAANGFTSFIRRVMIQAVMARSVSLIICGHINLLPLAWVVSRLKRCPLLLVVHGIDVWEPHRNFLVRALVVRVDAVISVSCYTAERMQKWCGVSESRFRILPNCVDLDNFIPRLRDEALVKRYDLAGCRVLMTVGRLAGQERYKGFDEVIAVLPILTAENPDLVYMIVGEGEDRARLRAKVHELGLDDFVRFTGYIDEREKVSLYNLADVYVMPSRGEGFGIVFLEAMACGVPAIGSEVDGSREALLFGRLGQLVNPNNLSEIAQAIRKALKTPRGRPPGLDEFSVKALGVRVDALVNEFSARAQ
jgi:phosphatidylinositol alpha-1,6-mannosyltransferase